MASSIPAQPTSSSSMGSGTSQWLILQTATAAFQNTVSGIVFLQAQSITLNISKAMRYPVSVGQTCQFLMPGTRMHKTFCSTQPGSMKVPLMWNFLSNEPIQRLGMAMLLSSTIGIADSRFSNNDGKEKLRSRRVNGSDYYAPDASRNAFNCWRKQDE